MSDLLADFPVVIDLRVVWGEMDAYQHVNNVTYFRWFETARVIYFERADVIVEVGAPQAVGPILGSASCRFRAPVAYPDVVRVGVRVSAVDRDRFTMTFAMVSEAQDRLVATGDGVVVAFDYSAGTKAPVPEAWKEGILRLQGTLPGVSR